MLRDRFGDDVGIFGLALGVTAATMGAESSSAIFLRSQYTQFLQSVGRVDEAAGISGG